jgi:hypothetical protein
MKLIERLYIAFYLFSENRKNSGFNRYLYHPRFDSILIFSILAVSNFSSILKLIKIPAIITTHRFDCFLFWILIIAFLIFHFEKKSSYKEIIEKYNTRSEIGTIELLGWSYVILTLIFFYTMHFEFVNSLYN